MRRWNESAPLDPRYRWADEYIYWVYVIIKMKLQWSNKSRCWSETISWWKENDLPTIFMILIISVFQFWIMTVFLLSESCFCANNISEIPQRSSLHMLIYLHQYILIKSMRSLQNSEECQWGVPRDVSCTIQSNVFNVFYCIWNCIIQGKGANSLYFILNMY